MLTIYFFTYLFFCFVFFVLLFCIFLMHFNYSKLIDKKKKNLFLKAKPTHIPTISNNNFQTKCIHKKPQVNEILGRKGNKHSEKPITDNLWEARQVRSSKWRPRHSPEADFNKIYDKTAYKTKKKLLQTHTTYNKAYTPTTNC